MKEEWDFNFKGKNHGFFVFLKGESNRLIKGSCSVAFDVLALELIDSVFEMLSSLGNTHLGGDDFDKRIIL